MKRLYKLSAYLLILYGIIHVAFTPVFFGRFGLEVMWFAGTGLGFVFLGNLNLVAILTKRLSLYTMIISSNLLGLLIMIVIVSMLHSIQAYIGLGITLLALTGSVQQYISQIKVVAETNFTARH